MKAIRWNLGKNIKLKLERGIGFEMIVDAVNRDAYTIDVVASRNHPGQKCFRVRLFNKNWVIPFKENQNSIYLFTIYERK